MNNRRRALLSISNKRLPAEFQEVEYIKTDGGAYINTRIIDNDNTRTYDIGIIQNKDTNTGFEVLFGSTINVRQGLFAYVSRANKLAFTNGIGSAPNPVVDYVINQGSELDIKLTPDKIYFNNVEQMITANYTGDNYTNRDIYLFCRNAPDPTFNAFCTDVPIKYFKVGDENNTLIRDYISCYSKTEVKDVNGNACSKGTIGLYDLVESKFYTNQGTGTFIVGNDVN